MGVIRFESFSENVRFHSPLKQMELVDVEIQRRRDPLSGRCAIYSSALKDKGGMFEEVYGLQVVLRSDTTVEGSLPNV